MTTNTARRVLLGGYAAKQCPVRTQHDFGPHPQTWVPDAEDQARLDAGIAYEAEMFTALTRVHPGAVVIGSRLRRDDAIAATLAATTALAWLLRRDYRAQPDRSLSGLATPAWVSLLTLLAGLGMAALLWLASLW